MEAVESNKLVGG